MSNNKRGTIAVDAILEEFYVRTSLDQEHVIHLAGLYEEGAKLPPLKVTRERNVLIEGRHRLAALKLINKKSVEVEWIEESDKGALLSMALAENVGGAMPPSVADIVYAMAQMLEAGMTQSVIIKNFSPIWPPSLIRRYIADAQSNLTKDRLIKAKHEVAEGTSSVGEAALKYKLKLDTLKQAITGAKKKRQTNVGEIKGALTSIFRGRGSSWGQLMKKVMDRFDDGELSINAMEQILDHLEQQADNTVASVANFRKRFKARVSEVKKIQKAS